MSKSGFACPQYFYQGFAVGMFFIDTFLPTIIYFPILDNSSKVEFLFVHYITLLCVFIAGIKAAYIDPTDRYSKISKVSPDFDSNLSFQTFTLCNSCNLHVKLQSRHCHQCNRCVENFDHHCKWLNNDIGSINYHYFAVLIWSLEIHMINLSIFGIFSIILTLVDFNQFERKNNDFWSTDISELIMVFIAIYTIFSVIAMVWLAYLIIFHICIKIKGITTYEYIIRKRMKRVRSDTTYKAEEIAPDGKLMPDHFNQFIETALNNNIGTELPDGVHNCSIIGEISFEESNDLCKNNDNHIDATPDVTMNQE